MISWIISPVSRDDLTFTSDFYELIISFYPLWIILHGGCYLYWYNQWWSRDVEISFYSSGPVFGKFISHWWNSFTKGQKCGILMALFVVILNSMLNKQSSCCWLEMLRHSWEIQQSLVESFTKGHWCDIFLFSWLSSWTSCWTNSLVAGDLRCYDTYVTSL